jgi:hemolysin III
MYYGERLNSITHLIGAVFALIGLGALLTKGIDSGEPRVVISFSVFGFTLVLLYTMSTLYHSFGTPQLKRLFRKLDHVSIYLLIGGTYTPYMLVALADGNGPYMLASVWILAFIGISLDVLKKKRSYILQLIVYLLMGWVVTLEYSSLKETLPSQGIWWLTFGGIAYTGGAVFYILDNLNRLKHAHGIWHGFVLLGSTSHFISIIGYLE